MNKKSVNNCAIINLFIGLITIFATIEFMMQIDSVLSRNIAVGILNYVDYSIFGVKMKVTLNTYSNVYNIVNYPLITIFIGIIYNICYIIKNRIAEDKVDS